MSHQQTTNLQKCVAILSKKKLKIFSSSLILQVLALSFNPYFLLIQIFFFSIFSFYPDFILSIFSFNPYWRIFQIEHSIGSITNTVQSIYLKSVVRRKIKKRTSNLMITYGISKLMILSILIIYWISYIVLIMAMSCRGSSRSITTRVSQEARSFFAYLQVGEQKSDCLSSSNPLCWSKS